MKFYIAYGSNTNENSMKSRCRNAMYIGKSKLENYRLAFLGKENNSYLTVIPDENSNLDVAVWTITDNDENLLDIYEGFPKLYRKESAKIRINGEIKNAMIYIMNDGYKKSMPSESYFQETLDGYIEHQLNTEPLFQAMFDINKL